MSTSPTAAMAADWIDPATLTRAEAIAMHQRNAAVLADRIARLGDGDPATRRTRADLAADRHSELELADLARHFEYPHRLADDTEPRATRNRCWCDRSQYRPHPRTAEHGH